MRLAFFGTGAFGLKALEALARSPHDLTAVITAPDRPSGRGLVAKPSPTKAWATGNGVPVIETLDPDSPESEAAIRALEADVFVVIAFGRILSARALEIPKILPLNVHASLLPRWRGAAPIHRAIMAGDSDSGVAVMRMVQKLDAGDVLLSANTPIRPDDDIETLEARLRVLGAETLVSALELVQSGKASFTPQDDSRTTYAKKLSKDDGKIDWRRPAAELFDSFRALKRWPTSYFFLRGKRVIVKDARPAEGEGMPGVCLGLSSSGGLLVACGSGALELRVLQVEGRVAVSAADFLRGRPLRPGSVLE